MNQGSGKNVPSVRKTHFARGKGSGAARGAEDSQGCDGRREYYNEFLDCDPNCYMASKRDCIIYGRDREIRRQDNRQKYATTNGKRFYQFKKRAGKEFADIDPGIHLLNALGAVIKNSDLQRAKTLVNVEITDEASLILASLALVATEQPKIKVRITIDCNGSGLNAIDAGTLSGSDENKAKKVWSTAITAPAAPSNTTITSEYLCSHEKLIPKRSRTYPEEDEGEEDA